MPRQVFKQPQLEEEFNRKGYVTVPFLTAEQTEQLKQAFFDTLAQSGGPKPPGRVDFESSNEISYDFTFIDDNPGYKKTVMDIITASFETRVNHYLNDYRPIIANYIRKKPGGGEVPMHQNWAFVDEEKFTSVSIWVPLVNSNESNGTLQIVEASHKRFGKFRGPMVPWELENLKEEIISRHLKPMNTRAGDAVILDDSIIHYSAANQSPGLRLAIQLILVPREAVTIHYHLDRTRDEHCIELLETPASFFTEFHPWLKPKGLKQIKLIPFYPSQLSYAGFLEVLNGPRFDETGNGVMPLLTDPQLQARFEEQGFVKIPLLNESEIGELLDFYHKTTSLHRNPYGFHISLDKGDENYIESVFDKLFRVIMPRLKPHVLNTKAFTASYVVKEAGLENIVPPHQDWSFVDESRFCSATVWIPLSDVDMRNGALGVIKGSHKLFLQPRYSPSPQTKSVLSNHLFTLFPYVEVIPMKAGEALIFNNRLVHASPPNTTSKARIGAGIGITQSAAPLLHYYKNPGDGANIEVYRVDESFFKRYSNARLGECFSNNQFPEGYERIQTLRKTSKTYTEEEITDLVSSTPGVNYNHELVKELAALYNYETNGAPKTPETEPGPATDTKHHEEAPVMAGEAAGQWRDERSFFQKYTPHNILAEIRYRLSKNRH